MAFLRVFRFFGGNKVLHPFGEVGLASYSDMAFKAGSNSVSTSTSRSLTLICWKATAEVPYTFSVVLLLNSLLMLLSALLKLSRSESKHSPIMPRDWLMAFQSYTTVKVFLGKQCQHLFIVFYVFNIFVDIDLLLQFLPRAFPTLGTKSSM